VADGVTRKITVKMVLEGEKKYKDALSDIKNESGLLDAQMKKLESQYENCAKGAEYYSEKQQILTQQIEKSETKVKTNESAHSHATEQYNKAIKAISEYTDELAEADDNIEQLKKEIERLDKAEDSHSETVKESLKAEEARKKELERGKAAAEAALKTAGERMTYWQTRTELARAECNKLENALNGVKVEFGDFRASQEAAAKSAQELINKTEKLKELLDDMGVSDSTNSINEDLLKKSNVVDVAINTAQSKYSDNNKGISDEIGLQSAKLQELESRYANCAKNAEYFTEKKKLLRQQIDQTSKDIDNSQNAYAAMKTASEKAAEQAGVLKKKLRELENAGEDNNEELEKTKKELESVQLTQKKAEGKMTSWATKTANANTTLNRLKNSIQKTEDELKGLSSSAQEAEGEMKNLGDSATKVEDLLVGIGAAKGIEVIKEQLLEAAEAANVLESAIAESKTLLDTDAVDKSYISGLSDEARQFALDMNVLTTEVTPALYNALSAGQDVENVFDFLETAQQSAVAGVTDINTSTNLLTSIINAYGKKVMSAENASDVLFTTVKKGKTTFPELASSIYNVIPTSASLGVTLEDVGAGMATITASGTPTSAAATQLRQVFNELSTAGTKVDTAFREISGKTFKQFISEGGNVNEALSLLLKYCDTAGTEFSDLWSSVEARSAALILTKNSDSFVTNLKAMQNSAGATAEAYGIMAETGDYAQKKLAVSAEAVKLALGDAVAPALNNAAEGAAEYLDELAVLIQAHPNFAKGVAAGTTALLTFAGAFALVKTASKTLDIALSTSKIGLIASAVGLLVGAVSSFILFSDQAKTKGEELADSLDSIAESAKSANDALEDTKAQSQGEIEMLDDLIEKYDELNNKEVLNADEKAQLTSIVQELKAVYGDLGFVLDETTGKYSVLTQEIIVYRDALMASIEAEYARDSAKNAYNSAMSILENAGVDDVSQLIAKRDEAASKYASAYTDDPYQAILGGALSSLKDTPLSKIPGFDWAVNEAVGDSAAKWVDEMNALQNAIDLYNEYRSVYNAWIDSVSGSDVEENKTKETIDETTGAFEKAEAAIERYDKALEDLPQTGIEWANAVKKVRTEIDLLNSSLEEQNKNGEISIDTALSLISGGTEYINLLSFENGAIRLNAQSTETMIKLRIQEQITANKAAYEKAKSAWMAANQELYAQESLFKAKMGEAEASGDEELYKRYKDAWESIAKERSATAEEFWILEKNAKATTEILESMYKSIENGAYSFSETGSSAEETTKSIDKATDSISEFGEAVVEALENKYDELREAEEEMIDDSISHWKDWEEKQVDSIEAQIAAIDNLREAEEKESKSAELWREYERLKYEARFASDEYNRAELEKAAANALQEYNDYQQDLADEKLKADLTAQKEQIEARAESEISALEEKKHNVATYYASILSNVEAEALELIKGDDEALLQLLTRYNPEFFGSEASFSDELAANLTSAYIEAIFERGVSAISSMAAKASPPVNSTINNTTSLASRSLSIGNITVYTSAATTETQVRDIAEAVMMEINKALN